MRAITGVLAPIEWQLWILAVVLGALDVWLTAWGLRLGLAEGNPVVATLIAEIGIGALVVLKGGVVTLAVGCRRYRPLWGPWLPLALVLPWLVAVAVNLTHVAGP